MNPTEKFQYHITEAVKKAAENGVHPAIVYMVLGGIQQDVLFSVKQSNRMAKEAVTAATAETILKSQNSKPASPAHPASPTNVIQLPKPDSTD